MLELGFFFYFCVSKQSFNDELSSFLSLLSEFPKTLTSIKFEICLTTWTPSGTLLKAEATNTIAIWITIDELLSGPLFPALTKVSFHVSDTSGRTGGFEMVEYLESRMARCKERGLLCTSFSKWYARYEYKSTTHTPWSEFVHLFLLVHVTPSTSITS
jgi:hypothetical protein